MGKICAGIWDLVWVYVLGIFWSMFMDLVWLGERGGSSPLSSVAVAGHTPIEYQGRA